MSEKWFDDRRQDLFFKFLKFPSVATDPAHHKDTRNCADFLFKHLKEIGMEVELWETSGQPVLFATAGPKSAPTLLVYHHYDVQPDEPSAFEPTIRDGNIYARGAQDNKGQCFYTLEAIRTLLVAGEPNFCLKLFIEGEEESGSEGTYEVFKKHREALKADALLMVDANIPAPNTPAITLGMRGIIAAEVSVTGSTEDLHSGLFGGIAYNPLRALSRALGSLWDDTGKVAIEGFYDDVAPLEDEDIHFIEEYPGIYATAPEPGFSLGQSGTIRPTVEINGICGGYTGEGFKTVIPATATAKVSCRLVANQDADKVAEALKAHLLGHLPEKMKNHVEILSASSASMCDPNAPIAKLVARAYEKVEGKPCLKTFGGGSIPIIGELAEASNATALAMGYGLDSDQIHSPNEHFGIDRLEKGYHTMLTIFQEFHEKT